MSDRIDQLLAAIRSSPCPYARSGRYVLGAEWSGTFADPSSLDRLASVLGGESGKRGTDRADTVIAVSYHPGVEPTCHHLSRMLLKCLSGLRERDSLAATRLAAELSHRRETWDFTFGAVRYFVPVFSSSYRPDHSRKWDMADSTVLLFQPEYAFRRFRISSGRPDRRLLSEQVLARFSERGRPYPIETVTIWPKASRFVKPERDEDGPIHWWLSE
ncbi:hypothetical protein [Pseudonocardia charpentierae]|uniref:YqcI/YcgG family protein n=1 Tax=Pseudonocardia charpentierae TaxID=3075545 RepID=A0ABU2N2I1_9PSEU|nr:hypothetical protein [Pseudonocardia sp. DSM 45834]MDT0348123.1 hypothetical protein [Pseudonocardia sp. DSM 45834]